MKTLNLGHLRSFLPKYSIFGAIGILLDLCVTVILIKWLDVPALHASIAGYASGTLFSFITNRNFNLSKSLGFSHALFNWLAVSALGLILTIVSTKFLISLELSENVFIIFRLIFGLFIAALQFTLNIIFQKSAQ